MSRLKASMVVDINDRTDRGARSVRRNLTALEAAQKRLDNKRRIRQFTRQDSLLARAMDEQARFTFERERDQNMRAAAMDRQQAERRRRQLMMQNGLVAAATRAVVPVTMAAAVAGAATAKAVRDYGQLEREINRIALNADKGRESIQPTLEYLSTVGKDAQVGLEGAVTGLETLIASGRSLDEGLSFLPAVAVTAKASGAAIEDVALSADALSGSMKIGAADMQRAFDILVAGGKAGKFELRDMAQYLPSLLPAFSALGYEGTEGLQKIVAMLQMARNQAGSSGEAATYMANVFQKMHSEETAKKFSKFGINLTKKLAQAKKEGKDVLDVFLDMTELATKGDLSKLTRLFTDAELQKGVRALITQRREMEALQRSLGNVDGSSMRDFRQIVNDTQGSIERLSNSWDRLWTKIGQKVSKGAVPVMDAVSDFMDSQDAQAQGVEKTTGGDEALEREQSKEFKRRYKQYFPKGKIGSEVAAYMRALEDVGRGKASSVMEIFDRLDRAKALAQHYRHGYVPGKGPPDLGASRSSGVMPIPKSRADALAETAREGRDAASRQQMRDRYQHGTGREQVAAALQKLADHIYAEGGDIPVRADQAGKVFSETGDDGEISVRPDQQGQAMDWKEEAPPFDFWRFLIGAAAGKDFDSREHFFGRPREKQGGILDDLDGSKPSMSNGPQEVSLSGTPTVITQPSGVQQVQVTNPTPVHAPITVSVSVTATSNADPSAIGQQVADQVGQKVKEELAGAYANTNWSVS